MGPRANIPDLAFAGFLIALGALGLLLAGELPAGRAGAMGPGYVPLGLSGIILLMGCVMGLRAAFAERRPFPSVALRPLLLVGASVALFGLLLPRLGLALTGVAVVLCAGFAATDVRLRENALLAVGLSAFAVALFVKALGLPIRTLPW
jgi:hypothetical protein